MTADTYAGTEASPDLYAVPPPPEPEREPDDPAEAPREASVARPLPSVPESERALLGGLMLAGRGARDTRLKPSDFYVPRHGLVFDAILRLAEAGNPIDPAAVVGALVDAGEIGRAGGAPYIHTLISEAPFGEFGYHVEQVREKAAARDMVAAGVRMQQIGYQPDLTAAERAEVAQKLAAELDPKMVAAPALWLDVLGETIRSIEEAADNPTGMLGIPTGLPDLDKLLRGLRAGMLYVVAARPGVGKTILLQNFARAAALKRSMPTAMFSLEMNEQELARRILSAELSIPLDRLETGTLDERDWHRLADAMGAEGAPLYVEDTPGQSLAQIRSTARSLHRQGGLSLILVDYLQLIVTPPASRGENREQQVAALSRGLKLLAKELEVPVVVAAQLNRGSEARSNKRPQLSDLRESGSLEQDADVVILIHRDDYYDRTERPGEADLIVAKNRHGQTGAPTVIGQLHLSRFMSSELHL